MTIEFAVPIVLCVTLLLGYALSKWHANQPVSRYARLIEDRAAEGVTGADLDREMTLRIAAVSLRQNASMAVLTAPGRYERFIAEHAKQEALLLAATDKQLARQFIDWVEAAELEELLHPAALDLVWRTVRTAGVKPGRSLIAALRPQA